MLVIHFQRAAGGTSTQCVRVTCVHAILPDMMVRASCVPTSEPGLRARRIECTCMPPTNNSLFVALHNYDSGPCSGRSTQKLCPISARFATSRRRRTRLWPDTCHSEYAISLLVHRTHAHTKRWRCERKCAPARSALHNVRVMEIRVQSTHACAQNGQ